MYLNVAAVFVKGRSRAHDDGVLTMSSVVAECDICRRLTRWCLFCYCTGVRLRGALHDIFS